MNKVQPPVQALFFDVFGTLVDWRSSVAREAERILAPLGYESDWTQCGLRTGYVARPNEHGPGKGETAPSVPVDVAAGDLADLAEKLGG